MSNSYIEMLHPYIHMSHYSIVMLHSYIHMSHSSIEMLHSYIHMSNSYIQMSHSYIVQMMHCFVVNIMICQRREEVKFTSISALQEYINCFVIWLCPIFSIFIKILLFPSK